ncbi:hypothetical protein VCS63_28430 [Achromobacter sp. D10]|uniref:hypothetical protein n=1 Tax=Achromobacter sp. D10 TaxID=3110765 RepID=UPI002B46CC8B|nr:hypothetical protein [Achromobacter sp. D10]MEB3099793.1 hypothetical protein [Achromobacter sp. D10]
MNRNRVGAAGFILGLALSAMPGAAAYGQSSAPAVPDPRPWPEAQTVRALLRADAAAALADCRVPGLCRSGPEPAVPVMQPVKASDDIRVRAIFGTARRLSADIIFNGAMLRYQAGRGEPVAGTPTARTYQLLAIDEGCVRLRRDDIERTACLDAGTARP